MNTVNLVGSIRSAFHREMLEINYAKVVNFANFILQSKSVVLKQAGESFYPMFPVFRKKLLFAKFSRFALCPSGKSNTVRSR